MWKFQLACVSSVLVDDFQTRQTIQNHVLQDRDLIPTPTQPRPQPRSRMVHDIEIWPVAAWRTVSH